METAKKSFFFLFLRNWAHYLKQKIFILKRKKKKSKFFNLSSLFSKLSFVRSKKQRTFFFFEKLIYCSLTTLKLKSWRFFFYLFVHSKSLIGTKIFPPCLVGFSLCLFSSKSRIFYSIFTKQNILKFSLFTEFLFVLRINSNMFPKNTSCDMCCRSYNKYMFER